MQLLSSEHMNVVDQAVWALGNIAGDGAECRDLTVRCGIIQPLLALITPSLSVSLCVMCALALVTPSLAVSVSVFVCVFAVISSSQT